MATEIERKFLVSGDFQPFAVSSQRIAQGYICATSGKTVRVRIRGDEAFLTIKGPSVDGGLSRYEFEQAISLADADELFKLCEPGIIEKVRYLVPVGLHTWDVDLFHGSNEGLVMAEIELSSTTETFELPAWAGMEVTGDRRYYNSLLAIHPYSQWEKEKK